MEKLQLKFDPEFDKELVIAIQYYRDISETLANRFRLAVNAQFNIIRANPLFKSIHTREIRVARLDTFPYSIYYSYKIGNNAVHVHSIKSRYQNKGPHFGEKWV